MNKACVRPLRRHLSGSLLGLTLILSSPACPDQVAPASSSDPPAKSRSDRSDAQQPDPQHILDNLDHPDWTVRHQTSLLLLRDADLDPLTIARLYLQARSAEQRHRLLDAALHHLVRRWVRQYSPADSQGALGVRLADSPPSTSSPPGPTILATLAGFPAHGWLEPGDRVLAVENQSLTDLPPEQACRQFQQEIRRHRCGQILRLRILRDSQVLNLEISLAGDSALDLLIDPQTAELRRPFALIWQQFRRNLEQGRLPELNPSEIPDTSAPPDTGPDQPAGPPP